MFTISTDILPCVPTCHGVALPYKLRNQETIHAAGQNCSSIGWSRTVDRHTPQQQSSQRTRSAQAFPSAGIVTTQRFEHILFQVNFPAVLSLWFWYDFILDSVYPKSLSKVYQRFVCFLSKLQIGQGSGLFPCDALQLDTLALARSGILDAGFFCTFSGPGPRGGPLYYNIPQGL